MSEPNEQIPPPQPHAAPPSLSCPKPLERPGIASTRVNSINRTSVAVRPPYSQCYYLDLSFQTYQAYHPLSVAGASSGQSHSTLAIMDPSLSLKSKTNLTEHMSLLTPKTTTSSKGNKVPHHFFPHFG